MIWIDYPLLLSYRMTFNFICGARAGGKTYGAVEVIDTLFDKAIWMRRTEDEAEMLYGKNSSEHLNPFKKYASDKGLIYDTPKISKHYGGIFKMSGEEKVHKGYIMSLSAISNVRGFDASDIDLMIYDEFIPELHRKKIRNEAEAFLNAYETVNRNREFEGREPVKCFLLSNSNNAAAPLLLYLGLSNIIANMKKNHEELYIDPSRSILIYLPEQQEFREKKEKTAIAALTRGTDFYDMAFKNEFAYNDFSYIDGRNLRGYKCLAVIDGIGIWFNGDADLIYCCLAGTSPNSYGKSNADICRFNLDIGRRIYDYYVHNRVYFQNFSIKEKMLDYLGA